MATCPDQLGCLVPLFEEIAPQQLCSGGDCEYRVCLQLSYDPDTCVKFGDGEISHTCVKNSTICDPPAGFGDAEEINDESTDLERDQFINDGGIQCQTGKPGDVLQFLFKDGRGCEGSSAEFPADILPEGVTFNCFPRPSTISSCTGNREGMECVWQVQVPDCTARSCTTTTTVTSTAVTTSTDVITMTDVVTSTSTAVITSTDISTVTSATVTTSTATTTSTSTAITTETITTTECTHPTSTSTSGQGKKSEKSWWCKTFGWGC